MVIERRDMELRLQNVLHAKDVAPLHAVFVMVLQNVQTVMVLETSYVGVVKAMENVQNVKDPGP